MKKQLLLFYGTVMYRMFTVNEELGYVGRGITSGDASHFTTFIVGVIPWQNVSIFLK
jgi:hypothetical protein